MAVDLFDIAYYRETNPDLAAAGLTTNEQLTNHFLTSGINENRLFSRFVDLNFYRASNSDLSTLSNIDLYSHLANSGVFEGRRFSPFFDLGFYQRANPDLAAAGFTANEQLFNHYQGLGGINEERKASPIVDLGFYKSANPDLGTFGNAQLLDHLRRNGIAEERRFSPVADLVIYESANPDLKAANLSNAALFQHIGTNGIFVGRRLSLSYDPIFYVQNNSDLASLNSLQLLDHFLFTGINEGRQASDYFNVNFYKSNPSNADLAALSNQQAHNHFEGFGFREGRIPGNSPFVIPNGLETGNNDNNLATATNLGTFNNRRLGTISQQINSTDLSSSNLLADIYRVLMPTASNVNIQLTGFNKPLSLEIFFDSNGDNVRKGDSTEVISSNSSGTSNNVTFTRTLGPGTYYVRVFTGDQTTNTNYNLAFSATTSPTTPPSPDPGDTGATALNVGILSNNVLLQNFIGLADPVDIYRFNIAAPSNFNLAIADISTLGTDAVTLELFYDVNNNSLLESNELIESRTAITPSLTFSKAVASGTYFLRVKQSFAPAGNTGFSLNLSAIPA